jgi:DeoR family myo-inositol catabolism operon transcriptional repressor
MKGVAHLKENRRKHMGELIAQRRSITMQELCDHFRVSMNTIRADVAYLVSTGAVEKVYGGVQAVDQRQAPLFTSRIKQHTLQKQRIAACAQQLIENGDTIFVDAGTTTMYLIDHLDPRKHVTIVTANLSLIEKAYDHDNVELIVLPGTVNRRTNSISGVSTLEFLSRYQFNKAFMGVTNVSDDGRLNTSTYIEYEVKRNAMKQSRQSFLLVDSAKFGATGLLAYGRLDNMSAIITDAECPENVRKFCFDRNIPILWA